MSKSVNREESDVNPDYVELEEFVFTADVIPLIIAWIVQDRLQFRELRYGVFEELSKSQRAEDFHNNRISFHYPEEIEDYPGIYCRSSGETGPESEFIVYLIGPARAFYEASFSFSTGKTPNEIPEHRIGSEYFQSAVEMMVGFIDQLHSRTSLMINSYIRETIEDWWAHKERQIGFERQRSTPLYKKYGIGLRMALRIYLDDLEWNWSLQGDGRQHKLKLRLVDEYECLLTHWRLLFKMVSEGNENWKEYAKAGKFEDTPEDLICKLWDVDRSSRTSQKGSISELALKHAARRVGLVKFTGIMRQRRARSERAKPKDYSTSQLYQFLHEGRLARLDEEKYGWMERVWEDYPVPEVESENISTPERRHGELE